MRPNLRALPIVLTLALAATAARAAVEVSFDNPDRYTDAGRLKRDSERTLKEIERYLQSLGKTYLPADQTLRIEVLDIDLAGDERPRRSTGEDVRVLRGRADWPRMRLRYALDAHGKAGEWREEDLSDMNYLMRPITRSDSLAYEKRMLEEWFKSRFGR